MAADPINRSILRTMLEQSPGLGPDGYYEVTDEGREALFVAFVVERWLQSAPDGPLDFDGREAGLAVATLAEAWTSFLLHTLARGPRTFPELRESTEEPGRRALRRVLSIMCRMGQLELRGDAGGGTAAYAVTEWARRGIAPLIAAARLERRDPSEETLPIDALDVEAAFRLALPLLELPEELSGSCRLGVRLVEEPGAAPVDAAPDLVGVTARIERGRVASVEPRLDSRADAWAAGSASDWLDTVIEPDAERVRSGGEKRLATALLDDLHETLFGLPTRR